LKTLKEVKTLGEVQKTNIKGTGEGKIKWKRRKKEGGRGHCRSQQQL
jgi:hypothetical protein